MAQKISQLTAKGATIADTDLVEVSQSAGGGAYVTRSVTGANIKALVTDANLTTTDITTNNVSTSKHGFVPKAPNDATQFLDGTGAFDTVKDTDLSLSDNTTNDVSAARHGFVPKLPNNTTTFLRGDGTFATPPAGGLTQFTEAENTAAPNATVPVDSLSASGAATNIDVAIVPKGTGAFMLDIPDNATTGGNKRGTNAVDLQTDRTGAARVASGNNSSVIGGKNNAAYLAFSIAGGEGAQANGTHAVAFGNSTTANNNFSFVVGNGGTASGIGSNSLGDSNTASGNYSTAIGQGATASGLRSFCQAVSGAATAADSVAFGKYSGANGAQSLVHGTYGNAFSVIGRYVHATYGAAAGDGQMSRFVLNKRTTNAVAAVMGVDNISGEGISATSQVVLQNQSALRFKGTIIGKKSGTTDIAAWDIDGLIVRGANAAATTLSVSNVTLVQNTPAWGTPALSADTTIGCLKVEVTGAASTNIQWTAVIETTEVIYA